MGDQRVCSPVPPTLRPVVLHIPPAPIVYWSYPLVVEMKVVDLSTSDFTPEQDIANVSPMESLQVFNQTSPSPPLNRETKNVYSITREFPFVSYLATYVPFFSF